MATLGPPFSFPKDLWRVAPEIAVHPPRARLAAYHRGELPSVAAERVAGHLALCARCAQELLERSPAAADRAASNPETPRAGRRTPS